MTLSAENAPLSLSLSSESGRAGTGTRFGVVRNNFSGKPEVFVERSNGVSTTFDANYAKGLDNHGARTGVAEVSLASERIRRLTPIEGERLQGFPDNWTIGADTQRYKQIGNAVPPPMIEAVASKLLEGWT